MEKNPFIMVVAMRHFRNLWLAQITSQIALNMLSFVLAIRVYQATQSNTAVSLLLLTFGIPAVVFGVITGGIVDHFDKKDVLVFCNLVRVLLLFAFFFFSTNLLAIYFLSLFFSLVTQLFIPAEASMLPALVSKAYLLTANSLFTVSFCLSTVLGFVASGLLLRMFGPVNVFLAMMVLMFLASLFVLRLPKTGKKLAAPLSLTIMSQTIREGLQFAKDQKRVRQSLLLLTFAQALVMTLAVLAPGFADRVLEIDLTDASYLVMGPVAIGLVAGALLVGEYGSRFLKGTIILVGIIKTGIILILISFLTKPHSQNLLFGNLSFAILLLFLLGFFNSFISIPANTILQQDSGVEMRGRIYGILTAATSGVSVLPVFFSGVLADAVGVGRTLSLIGLIVLAIGAHNCWQRRIAPKSFD